MILNLEKYKMYLFKKFMNLKNLYINKNNN